MARLNALPDTVNREQLLFGINQGAVYEDIRIEHAKEISKMNLDGYAVGGLAVGESHEEMYRILDADGSASCRRTSRLILWASAHRQTSWKR